MRELLLGIERWYTAGMRQAQEAAPEARALPRASREASNSPTTPRVLALPTPPPPETLPKENSADQDQLNF